MLVKPGQLNRWMIKLFAEAPCERDQPLKQPMKNEKTVAAAAVKTDDEELQFWQLCYAAAIRAGNRAVAEQTADAAVADLQSRKTTCE